jgi:glycosyltransferase involved in cell wall biosynthesis
VEKRFVLMKSADSSLHLVSVLVPSYNSEAYLRECLESALSQTYPSVEIIVVDDGSTDSSLEIAKSFKSRGVRVVSQSNRGQAGALNTAFDASKGHYLQYLDADDVLDRRKIEVQVSRLDTTEPMTVACGAWARFNSETSEALFKPEMVWQDLDPVDWLVKSWAGGGMMHVAAWLIPRKVALKAGPWVESLRWAANLDGHFFTRTLLASIRCAFCQEAKSFYRSGHSSMSSWKTRRSLESTLQVLLDTGEALVECENSPRTRKAFADNLMRYVFSTYPESLDLVSLAEAMIKELGGSDLQISGGSLQLRASRLFGWKMGKRLHSIGQTVRWRG